jgi:hypothetical protein
VTYVKAALYVIAFAIGFYFGGLRSKTALETVETAQSENTAKAVLAQKAALDAEEARLNGVIAKYEATPIDPIAVGLAGRVLQYARVADCPVPKAASITSGTGDTAAQSSGDASLIRLSQAVLDACAQDAAQLTALQQAWPQ